LGLREVASALWLFVEVRLEYGTYGVTFTGVARCLNCASSFWGADCFDLFKRFR
jgi:hypothetical protein